LSITWGTALVSVLQYAEGLSDRQAVGQVRARMDWKFLLGLELDDPGFDFTIPGDFRSRLIAHGLEERVLARLSGAGLLRVGGRQRTDSMHVLAAVRTLNRMEFAGETVRAALEALTETCEPDSPHVITNVETTDATTDDGAMTPTIHQHLAHRRLAPDEHVAGADTHHTRRSGTGQEPALAQDAFAVDGDAEKVTCPRGAVSVSWSGQRKPSGTPVARVHFALAGCRPCPLRSRCSKAANGRWGRSLTLLPREQQEILTRQRAEQQTSPLRHPRRRRGHHLPGRPPHPAAPHPLRRPGQDPSRPRPVRHRHQPHPHRCLAQRHPARRYPRLSSRPPRSRSMTRPRSPKCGFTNGVRHD
jgi:hypothetical protein